MGNAIKAICTLINNAVLHSWSATIRLILVLITLSAMALLVAAVEPRLLQWW